MTQTSTKLTKSLTINEKLKIKNSLQNRTSSWWETDDICMIINKKFNIRTHKTLSSNLNQKKKWEFAKVISMMIFWDEKFMYQVNFSISNTKISTSQTAKSYHQWLRFENLMQWDFDEDINVELFIDCIRFFAKWDDEEEILNLLLLYLKHQSLKWHTTLLLRQQKMMIKFVKA